MNLLMKTLCIEIIKFSVYCILLLLLLISLLLIFRFVYAFNSHFKRLELFTIIKLSTATLQPWKEQ